MSSVQISGTRWNTSRAQVKGGEREREREREMKTSIFLIVLHKSVSIQSRRSLLKLLRDAIIRGGGPKWHCPEATGQRFASGEPAAFGDAPIPLE